MKKRPSLLVDYSKGKASSIRSSLRRTQSTETSLRRTQSIETLDRKELVNRSLHALATSSSNLNFSYHEPSSSPQQTHAAADKPQKQVNFRMRRISSFKNSNHATDNHATPPALQERRQTWTSKSSNHSTSHATDNVPMPDFQRSQSWTFPEEEPNNTSSGPPSTRAETIKMLIRGNSERSLGGTNSNHCYSQLGTSTSHHKGKRRSSLRARKGTSLFDPEASNSSIRLDDLSGSSFAHDDPHNTDPVLIVPTRVLSLADSNEDDSSEQQSPPIKPRPTLGKKRRSSHRLSGGGLRKSMSMADMGHTNNNNDKKENDTNQSGGAADRRRQFRRSGSGLNNVESSNPGRQQQLRRSSSNWRVMEDDPQEAFNNSFSQLNNSFSSLRHSKSSSSVRRQNSFKNLSIGADASLFITGSRIRRHGSEHQLKRSTSCRKILEEEPASSSKANFTWGTTQKKGSLGTTQKRGTLGTAAATNRGSLRLNASFSDSFSNLVAREGGASPSA